jgi:membrane peptidoglycan carboxypeptidase
VFDSGPLGKGKSVGRLVTMSALGGVLAAGLAVPFVGSVGLAVKTAANKFETMSTGALGQVPQRSEILDSKGHLLAYIYGVDEPYYYSAHNIKKVEASGLDRIPVSYSQISPNMRQAIVAIEDDRFWHEGAIDFRGTMRALVNDLEHKPVQGGSTLAQQYVKNALILTAKNPLQAEGASVDTLSRKIHELRLAVQVEHKQSKAEILAGYLNDAYYGYPIIGIQTAAEAYFHTSAKKLTLAEAADLAGMVENPDGYSPVQHPATSLERRDTVLARMAQLHMISQSTAKATEKKPLGLHLTALRSGCATTTVKSDGFFCDYAIQSLLRDPALGKTPDQRAHELATGGLKIYTTLNPADQRAADNAVNYVLPAHSGAYNPGHLADAEALIQPGTGRIRAIAEDRPYGTEPGQTTIDFAATTPYDGGVGIQTGSSSKLFTLITALEQGVPFGYSQNVPNSFSSIPGYNDCAGAPVSWTPGPVNAGAGDKGSFTLYTGTTSSINTFYAQLERKVGLCNVVRTAAKLGMTWGSGTSLFKSYDGQPPADQTPSFTLGSVTVAPLSMAAAYATVAARGTYCAPVALQSIVTDTGKKLGVPSAHCHRVMSQTIADAVNYVLQGVLTAPGATADNRGIGRPAAGKTGTAGGAGEGTPSSAFAGYTPTLAGYAWAGGPTRTITMTGYPSDCYRDLTGPQCPAGGMFGDNAPAAVWQMTFEHAALGPPLPFQAVPPGSALFSQGSGKVNPKPPAPPKTHGGGGGGGGGGHGFPGGGGQGGGGGGHGGGGGPPAHPGKN